MLLRTALTIIGSVGYLLYLNVRLALIALMVGPLMGWLVSVINRLFRRYSRRIQDSMGDVTRVAKESFEAPRLIKVYNAEEHLGRQFDAVNEHNLRSQHEAHPDARASPTRWCRCWRRSAARSCCRSPSPTPSTGA